MKSKKNINKKLRNNKSKINKKNKRKLKSKNNRKTNKKITGGGSAVSEEAKNTFTVTVVSDIGSKELQVRDTDKIHNVIAEAFECRGEEIREVQFGSNSVVSGESFEDHSIEDGGRLSVVILDLDSTELNNQNCIDRIGSENLKKKK